MGRFRLFISLLKKIQAAMSARRVARPEYQLVLQSLTKRLCGLDTMSPCQVIALVNAYGSFMREMAKLLKKDRGPYSRLLYTAGTQLMFCCPVIAEHKGNWQVAENILTVTCRTIGHALVDDARYYDRFGKEWDEDKKFLVALGHTILDVMVLECNK